MGRNPHCIRFLFLPASVLISSIFLKRYRMHRFRDSRTVSLLVSFAILEWLKWIMAAASFCLLVWGSLSTDTGILLVWLAFSAMALAFQVLVFAGGGFTPCPLCMVPILGNSQCHGHKRAGRFLGSVRLKVSWDVLTKNRMTCPFCNERIDLLHTHKPS